MDGSEEEIADPFVCCVCLDVLHKPIVLPCGHISCFWCVNKSMDSMRESHCPTCRHTYYHFPNVCQMLHFLLLKIYPVAYKRRDSQMLEEERETGLFSPQFDNASGSQVKPHSSGSLPSSSGVDCESNSCSDPLLSGNQKTSLDMEQSSLGRELKDEDKVRGKSEVCGTLSVEESNHTEQNESVSVADMLCTACNQLLVRPVVLNCGHAYCEVCIINLSDEVLKCQLCQSPHPRGVPKVCLPIDQFLLERFPIEYARRRDTVQLNEVKRKLTTSHETSEEDRAPWWSHSNSIVHFGIGCDCCGICPIVGDRYRCKDCTEKVGFDLCGDCYNAQSKLPGRFNQQHRPEHEFEHVQSTNVHGNIMLRLVRGPLGGHIAIVDEASQHTGVLFQAPDFSDMNDDDDDDEHEDENENENENDSSNLNEE